MAVDIDHSGSAVLVTGAGAGIGREIARWFARAGASVAVNDVRAEPAAAVVEAIERDGGRAFPLVADCRDEGQVSGLVAQTVERFGGLDVAVNNVGMLPPGRTVA
ncbi:MAG: SDR family NAD(P)-dependent oxidoreductase, partial [Actinobacteria bacterium]|nr:SDR family NAD(P)-dependent oxidoreductase [Actinomycetota bacterium]